MRLAGWGFGLTVLVAAAAGLAWGRGAIFGAVVFGLLATAIQLAANALVRPALGAPFAVLVKRWAMGMGLRLGGVVAFAVFVIVKRELFPPLPSALGYVGVIVPLLFMEIRSLK